jgi:putative thioredoxin
MADSPFIVEVTRDNYEQLMQTSFEVPVLMDFWADWCQPCHALMPVLARLADEYQGKFLLAKLNTEQEQEIASAFGIRSIPTCKLFIDGQPADEFMGALPEQAVRQFLDKHIAREPNPAVAQARDLLLSGDASAAAAALENLPPEDQGSPEVAKLRGRLLFAEQAAGAPPAVELETTLAADPANLEVLHQLAMRKVVDEDYDMAMDLLLKLMQKDRSYGDDAGRVALLQVFELLGDDPRVAHYRRRMASLLY